MDNKKDIAFWTLIIVIVLMLIYMVFFIKSESFNCISNPLIYGVSKYESNTGEFTCTCSAPLTNPILVTRENISLLYNYDTFLLPDS